ncbi:MAG TPA: hypothetical protein PLE88_10960 [Anaerohalosphaeraceae bacterium]|nr:hypothetical protein [Anaerohalosphaeraceae bacterium]
MTMNKKAKGARLERKTIKMLQSAGYQCIRSAASLGPFDIIAMNHLGFRCIQIKSNDWPRPDEREGLRAAAKSLPPNALIECWRWNDNAREPIIKLLDEFN